MRTQKFAAIAAALAPLVLAAPVAGAGAATTPPASASSSKAPVFTFIPPKVGPLQVIIGATFIGGQQISPGVNVSTPGTSLPPIIWSPPAS